MSSAAARSGLRALIESDAVGHERLPMLEVVCDRVVRTFATNMRSLTSDTIEVLTEEVQFGRFGEMMSGIVQPAMFGVFRVAEWDSYGIIAVEPSLIYSVVDALLGGSPADNAKGRMHSRNFTSIETSLVSRVMQLALADFASALKPIAPVSITLERVESSPQFAAITAPSNVTATCFFSVALDGRGGRFALLLPHTTLEPVRDKLVQRFMGEKLGADAEWQAHFERELLKSELDVRAVLAERELSLRAVDEWQVGQTIAFGKSPDEPLQLRHEDMPLASVQLGRRGRNCAVRLLGPLAG